MDKRKNQSQAEAPLNHLIAGPSLRQQALGCVAKQEDAGFLIQVLNWVGCNATNFPLLHCEGSSRVRQAWATHRVECATRE